MNKVFLFVIMLVSVSFVGCIEDSTDDTLIEDSAVDESSNGDTTVDESSNEDTTQEDETIAPVGVDNATNMAPYVDAGVWIEDNFRFFLDESEETTSLGVFVNWAAKDFDGTIASAGFDFDLDMGQYCLNAKAVGQGGTIVDPSRTDLVVTGKLWPNQVIAGVPGLVFLGLSTFAFVGAQKIGKKVTEKALITAAKKLVINNVDDLLASLGSVELTGDELSHIHI